MIERLRDELFRVLDSEGSMRGFALLRVATVIIVTQRLTYGWAPHQLDMSPTETALSIVFWISAWTSFVGWRTRTSMFVFSAAYTIIHLYYGKHLGHGSLGSPAQPVQVLWLLTFTPCGRSLSLDRWLALRAARAGGGAIPDERGPTWMRAGFVLHLVTIYFWALYDKTDALWFTGGRLERIWMSHYGSSDDFVLYGGLLHTVCVAASWMTFAAELALVVGLFIPRLWKFLIPLALAMHLAFWLVLGVGPFSSMMMAAYLGVADPQRIHDFLDSLLARPPSRDEEE